MKRTTPWQPWAIFIGIVLILLSGSLLTENIGTVGLRNSYVAQSLSEGYGTFWVPSLLQDVPDTHNYMPLGYWMQAKFIGLFGTSLLGDKLYSILIFLLCGIMIDLIWHLLGNDTHTDWIPLVFWVMSPIVPWSATNNALEGPLTLFVLLSIYSYVIGLVASLPGPWERGKVKHYPDQHLGDDYHLQRFLFTALSAFFSALAFLVKGFSGLFVLFLPFAFWLFAPNKKNLTFFVDMVVYMGTWAVLGILLAIISPDSHISVASYIQHNLIGGLLTEQNVNSHFHILFVLIAQMALATVMVIVVVALLVKEKHIGTYLRYWGHKDDLTRDEIRNMRFFYIFFALGCFGVLPIMVGLKQHSYYLLTVIPCFAISFGCLVQERVAQWVEAISQRVLVFINVLGISLLFLGVLLNLTSITKITVDKTLITDIKAMLPELQQGETIFVTPEMMDDEAIPYYFHRYKNIQFDTVSLHEHMVTMYEDISRLPYADRYEKMQIPLDSYYLYRLKKGNCEELATEPSKRSTKTSEADDAGSLGATSDPTARANSKTLFPEEKCVESTKEDVASSASYGAKSTANSQPRASAASKKPKTVSQPRTTDVSKPTDASQSSPIVSKSKSRSSYEEEKYMVGY